MFNKNDIILFQGDSITDGARSRDDNDVNHLLGDSYAHIVAAKLAYEYVDLDLTFINKGVSGNGIADFYACLHRYGVNLKPNLMSILIGANDYYNDLKRFDKIYRMVLDETLENLPDVKLVLCEPFYLAIGNDEEKEKTSMQNCKKVQEIVLNIAKDYGTIFVPLQKKLEEYAQKSSARAVLSDGVHPTPLGNEIIARQWLKEVCYGK